MQERDLNLRAVSDLMIRRLRKLLGLPFIGSDNTPPGLLNDAFMFGESRTTSALSQLDFGINGLQFASGVVDFHLPVDASLSLVDIV